jgi:ligand-binding sensor domain-containing protein/signal transduction histidine kinase
MLAAYRSKWACLLILLSFTSLTHAERFPFKSYAVSDGLAHNQVNKIVRDSRGFLWMCTADGLSRYDGYTFTNFNTDQGLPNACVNDFLETRAGEFWIATRGGVVRFNPTGRTENKLSSMFTRVPPPNEREAASANVLLEDRFGKVWCGTNKGLYCIDQKDGSADLRSVDLGMPTQYAEQGFIVALAEDQNGNLWAGTPSGLYRRSPEGDTAHFTVRSGLPDDYVQALLADDKGRLWVGTRSRGFLQFLPGDTRSGPTITHVYGVKQGLPTGWVFQLFETADRRYWAATNAGVIEFFPDSGDKNSQFRAYTTRNGLSYHEITALNEDLGGNLWMGTGTEGAIKLSRNGFVTYDSQDGIANTNAIFSDRLGHVCIRGSVIVDPRTKGSEGLRHDARSMQDAYQWRLGRFDGEQFTWLKPSALLNFGWVAEQVTFQARNGEWWIGTSDGLYRFPSVDFDQLKTSQPINHYTTKDGLAAEQVFRIFEDSSRNVWISTISSPTNGLALWNSTTEKLIDLTKAPGFSSNANDLARSFAEDASGNIWVGFNSGIARYRNGAFKFFPTGGEAPPDIINNLYVDRSGRLWAASARGGVLRIDDPSISQPNFIRYTSAQGLSSNNVEVITEDLEGRIYVGGGRGLDELDPETGLVKHFTTADGLAGAFLAAFRDRNGELWFGTTHGLSRFLPTRDERISEPTILISGLLVAGSQRQVSAVGETTMSLSDLSPDQNQLQIDYVGLSFAPGVVLRYQYKLDGVDSDWQAPTTQRTVTFARLGPGHYTFRVRAVNSDGTVSLSPAIVSFTVLAPIWRRWWFITLVILGAMMIISALYRYRVARLIEMTNMRTRIATDLHDDIGANLTRIALLSEVANEQQNGNGRQEDSPLASIARIARESVGSMSDIVWAINPDRESFLDLTRKVRQHADEVFTLRDINLHFNAPSTNDGLRLSVDVRRDLLLIFKEAVNNAARHSRCTEVRIDLQVDGTMLLLTIVDNGIGFDPSVESGGQGLRSMRRRATMLGGIFEINTRTRGQTIVRVSIPLARARL